MDIYGYIWAYMDIYGYITHLTRINTTIFLLYLEGVAIVNFPGIISTIVGKNLTLTCQADVEKGTFVTFKWEQNFMPIRGRNAVIQHNILARKSLLIIKHITLENQAIYSCTATVDATNEYGRSSDMAEVSVNVKGKIELTASSSLLYC